MRYDDLIKPISPDEPCGPDLLDTDDDAFIDYYFSVEDRLPSSYFNLARGTLFDSKTVDAKGEAAQIDALLKKSRDLRLLGIEAKFQILAGRFKGFVDAMMAMAGLLETFPDDLHPQLREGDNIDRRNALEELDTLATIVAPLEYAPLMTDRRYGDVVFRAWATGSGVIQPREGEEPGDAAGITGVLGNSENADAVDKLHDQLSGLLDAVERINTVCQGGSAPFTPKLERLTGKLTEILDMVRGARGDLSDEDGEGEAGAGDAAAAGAPAGTVAVATLPATEVPNHYAAREILEGVERYFARHEPASMALVLVTQSRILVGRPLVEAMDALMESTVDRAEIDFGTENGFKISMSRMRDLSNQAGIGDLEPPEPAPAPASPPEPEPMPEPEPEAVDAETEGAEATAEDMASEPTPEHAPEPAPQPEPAPPPAAPSGPPEIMSRDHAAQALKSVEEFFRIREPASPIPVLLFKARNMLGKDFHALMREVLPPETY